MTEHKFYKTVSPKVLEAQEKAFSKLPAVSKMKLDKFELAINSIRRVHGSRFYDLKNTDIDFLDLYIDDGASFNMESLKSNTDQASNLTQVAASLIQQFFIMNEGEVTFTPEFMNKKQAQIAVTSVTKGVKKDLLSMMDFAPICAFNDSNQITGVRFMKEIMDLGTKIQDNDKQYEKMKQTNNVHAMQQLDEERRQLMSKMHEYTMSLVQNFLNIIKKFGDVDDVTDVYDVNFTFDENIKDQVKKDEVIHARVMFDVHDVSAINVIALENKFHVNHDTVGYSEDDYKEE